MPGQEASAVEDRGKPVIAGTKNKHATNDHKRQAGDKAEVELRRMLASWYLGKIRIRSQGASSDSTGDPKVGGLQDLDI